MTAILIIAFYIIGALVTLGVVDVSEPLDWANDWKENLIAALIWPAVWVYVIIEAIRWRRRK